MFPNRFFAARYFPDRYFPVGAAVAEEEEAPQFQPPIGGWVPMGGRFPVLVPVLWRLKPRRSRVRSSSRGRLSWLVPLQGEARSEVSVEAGPLYRWRFWPLAGRSDAACDMVTRFFWHNDGDYWERKYRLEVVRQAPLRERVRALEAEVEDLEDLVAMELSI